MKMFRWCDNYSNVLEWSSEPIAIPYLFTTNINKPPRIHRYYPDLIIKLKGQDNIERKFLVEVKPKNQTVPPTNKNRKSKSRFLYEQVAYAKNMAKWEAAKNGVKKVI